MVLGTTSISSDSLIPSCLDIGLLITLSFIFRFRFPKHFQIDMASKRRSDEELYKKLNAQLQSRLKKAEKDLSVLQASQDKTRNTTSQFEQKLSECKYRMAQSEQRAMKTNLLGDKLASDFFAFHKAFRDHLTCLRSTVSRLGGLFEPSVTLNDSKIGDTSEAVERAKIEPASKEEGMQLCQQNIDAFIAIQDELEGIVKCLGEHALETQKTPTDSPQTSDQTSDPILECEKELDVSNQSEKTDFDDDSIWGICKLPNVSKWCETKLLETDDKEALELAELIVDEISEQYSRVMSKVELATSSAWTTMKKAPNLFMICPNAEGMESDNEEDEHHVGSTGQQPSE